jgi:hypothetical protein
LDATFTRSHWPLPRPVTLIIAESYPYLLTGVSPSLPAHSRALQLQEQHSIRYNAPHLYYVTITDSVWALPFSLAATNGISIDFSSSSYSDASLRTVRPPQRKQGSLKRDLIRKSRVQRSHAPTPSLSQLATSFITYQAESSTNRRLCTSSNSQSYCGSSIFMILV